MNLKIAAIFILAATLPVSAQDAGFQTPSGNIHCAYFAEGDAGPSLRCDIRQITNRPPRPPAGCDLDYGQAFSVATRSRGERLCYGDTVANPGYPVLGYDRAWQRSGITCLSTENGLACRNAVGGGFDLSRARQRVF